jgi:hypothetical protein
MGVETFTDIASLNETWPLGTDPRSEGDDHIRGIKKTLKAIVGGPVVNVRTVYGATSGTYTKPTALKFLEVTCVGAGGGGGYGKGLAGGMAAAAGGGAGATSITLYAGASIGATTAYTVGAGGAGGVAASSTVATAGGTSLFAALAPAARRHFQRQHGREREFHRRRGRRGDWRPIQPSGQRGPGVGRLGFRRRWPGGRGRRLTIAGGRGAGTGTVAGGDGAMAAAAAAASRRPRSTPMAAAAAMG